MLLADLMQGFGRPEVLQIREDGALRSGYLGQPRKAMLDWAKRHEVPVVADRLE